MFEKTFAWMLLLACLAAAPTTRPVSPPLAEGSRVLFIGDSITALYPKDPTYSRMSHCYVTMFDTLLSLKYPGLDAEIISKGVGGNTVEHLRQRWDADVIQQKPDWLFILIGINDADYLFRFKTQEPETYRRIYDGLLRDTRRKLPRTNIVLLTPFIIARERPTSPGGGHNPQIFDVLPQYVTVVKELGEKHRLDVIDLDGSFRNLLQYEDEDRLAKEPIHPGERGMLFMALQLLQYLESKSLNDRPG